MGGDGAFERDAQILERKRHPPQRSLFSFRRPLTLRDLRESQCFGMRHVVMEHGDGIDVGMCMGSDLCGL